MRELAESEPCIFVGRAAGYVLDQDEDIERLIRIFVYADKVKKVQRVMEVDCIDEERAKRRIKKIEEGTERVLQVLHRRRVAQHEEL